MAIRKNADGRTATVTRTGVTGGAGDGSASAVRRSNPQALPSARVAKRLPIARTAVPRNQR